MSNQHFPMVLLWFSYGFPNASHRLWLGQAALVRQREDRIRHIEVAVRIFWQSASTSGFVSNYTTYKQYIYIYRITYIYIFNIYIYIFNIYIYI